MKPSSLFLLILFLWCISIQRNSYGQISRGATPDELYISGEWYLENYSILHYGIFHSIDNGENLSLRYENTDSPPLGEMKVGWITGDATPGVIYNTGDSKIWVSFDYGQTWEFRENYNIYAKYFTGVDQGVILKSDPQGFFRSSDYAESFEELPITITCGFSEVGFSEQEFFGIYGESGLQYYFSHSLDYGQSCIEIPLDSSIAFYAPGGQFPELSRGATPGELYLISWTPELHYKIFRSEDNGITWEKRYESEYIDIYNFGVQFTAGREPGSFYVLKRRISPEGNHTWLYIEYSSDYGETFTTYFHDLDSTATGDKKFNVENIEMSNQPNPFFTKTTFRLKLPNSCKNPVLNIYNINGKLIRQIDISGKNSQIWDGKDDNGRRINSGIYLYNIESNDHYTPLKKILFLN